MAYTHCIDCGKELSIWAKYEPIKRCSSCGNKHSYKKRLPTIVCGKCKKEFKTTSFKQKYCVECMNDKHFYNEYKKANNKKTWEKYPEKRKARAKACNHIQIKKGTLCEVCNKNIAVDKHHEDYTKPLDVNIVCKKCHMILDKNKKNKTK